MKRLFALAAAAAFGAAILPAFANETADQCKAYAQKNGTDASGCDCLGAAAAKDPTLAAALARIATPADLDAADAATKAAIQACWPNSSAAK